MDEPDQAQEWAGHTDWVCGLWAQDERLYSASLDGTVRVWPKQGGRELLTLTFSSAVHRVLTVRTPALGRIVVAGGSDGPALRRWNDSDGSELRPSQTPEREAGATWALAAWDGVIFAGGSYRAIRAVSAETGEELYRLSGHTGTVHALCIEDEGLLHSGSDDTTIRTWDLASGMTRQLFKGHSTSVLCLAATKTGLFSGAYDGQCRAWNRSSGRCLFTIDSAHGGSRVAGLHVRDSTLCTAGGDGSVAGWTAASGTCLFRIKAHSDELTAITSGVTGLLYTASRDATVKAWQQRDAHADTSDSDVTVGHTATCGSAPRTGARVAQLERKHREDMERAKQEHQKAQIDLSMRLSAVMHEADQLRDENSQLRQALRVLTLQYQRVLNGQSAAPGPARDVDAEDDCDVARISDLSSPPLSPTALPEPASALPPALPREWEQ